MVGWYGMVGGWIGGWVVWWLDRWLTGLVDACGCPHDKTF